MKQFCISIHLASNLTGYKYEEVALKTFDDGMLLPLACIHSVQHAGDVYISEKIMPKESMYHKLFVISQ